MLSLRESITGLTALAGAEEDVGEKVLFFFPSFWGYISGKLMFPNELWGIFPNQKLGHLLVDQKTS